MIRKRFESTALLEEDIVLCCIVLVPRRNCCGRITCLGNCGSFRFFRILSSPGLNKVVLILLPQPHIKLVILLRVLISLPNEHLARIQMQRILQQLRIGQTADDQICIRRV